MNSLSAVVDFPELKCQEMVKKHLISHEAAQCLIAGAKSLFSDDGVAWPLHFSAFYLGRIPDITKLLGFEQPTLHFPYPPPFDCLTTFTPLLWNGTLTQYVSPAVSGAKSNVLPPSELIPDFSIVTLVFTYCASQCTSHCSGGKLSLMRF